MLLIEEWIACDFLLLPNYYVRLFCLQACPKNGKNRISMLSTEERNLLYLHFDVILINDCQRFIEISPLSASIMKI